MSTNAFYFDRVKAEDIVNQLLTNAAWVRYGAVSVSAKLHGEKVVGVSCSSSTHEGHGT